MSMLCVLDAVLGVNEETYCRGPALLYLFLLDLPPKKQNKEANTTNCQRNFVYFSLATSCPTLVGTESVL